MLAFFGGGRVPACGASKGGGVRLAKSLAIACAQDRIRVNAVAPLRGARSQTQALREDHERSAALLARTPLGRWGKRTMSRERRCSRVRPQQNSWLAR